MDYQQYEIFAYGWIGLAVIVFIILRFITAPYGRHAKATWGPMVNNKTGWFVMEAFVLVVLFYFIANGKNIQSITNIVIISLFSFHYLNRSLVFPWRLHTKGKKMPVIIMLMGMTFNLANGFFIGYFLGNFKVYEVSWLWSPQFIIGVCLFAIGLIINWQSDTVLIRLRSDGGAGYKIPYGRMFRYVSCPNLMGETIEWFGFAILLWSLPGWVFFIWTFANLIPRALDHHKWYLEKFSDYPKERKAIFPYLL